MKKVQKLRFLRSTRGDFLGQLFSKLFNYVSGKDRKISKSIKQYHLLFHEKSKERIWLHKTINSKWYGLTTKKLFYVKLEQRLDVLLYRSGLVSSIYQARQLIKHGHCLVNSNKVISNSILLKRGDYFEIHPSLYAETKKEILKKNQLAGFINVPSYLETDFSLLSSALITFPNKETIPIATV